VATVKDPGQIVILGLINKAFNGGRGILPGLDAKPQFRGRFNQPGVSGSRFEKIEKRRFRPGKERGI